MNEAPKIVRKPDWQKLPVVPRKKGKPRDQTTYRWFRREAAKEYRKLNRNGNRTLPR